MATTYFITGSPVLKARRVYGRNAAIFEAGRYATEDGHRNEVTVTTNGRVVHRIPARPAPAAPTQRRAAQEPAAQEGWEVLYDKPRAGYQVWRATTPGGGYALWCPAHQHLHRVRTLAAVPAARKQGHGCPQAH